MICSKQSILRPGKLSPDEAEKFKADFEKMKFDQQMKMVASAGAGVAVGQVLTVIPHPAARVAKYAWTATGAVAANNKIAEVSDKLQDLQEKHPRAFQVMEEHRDQKLAPVHAERRERWERTKQELMYQQTSTFSA